MEQIRTAVGAQSVVAGTCFAVIELTTPIKIGNKEITLASDVTETNRDKFNRLFKGTIAKRGRKGKCIVNKSKKSFFAVGGRFVMLWFNPSPSPEWIRTNPFVTTRSPLKAWTRRRRCPRSRIVG